MSQLDLFADDAPIMPVPIPATLGMVGRDYQDEADRCLGRELARVDSTLMMLATGLGKTKTSVRFGSRWQDGRVLVAVHTEEILHQWEREIFTQTGEWPDVEHGSRFADKTPDLKQWIVASKDSLHPDRLCDPRRFNDIGLLIFDEGDMAAEKNITWTRIRKELKQRNPNLKMFGVTATKRSDDSALEQVYETVAFQFGIREGWDNGWLCPVDADCVVVKAMNLRKADQSGDFKAGELGQILSEDKTVIEMAEAILDHSGSGRCLAFTGGIMHAEKLSARLEKRHRIGCSAWICGDAVRCPRDHRRRVLESFAEGSVQFMCNVGVLTRGYDLPTIELLAMGRPTKSESLYLQMLGRGTRTLPGVVDFPRSTVALRIAAIAASAKPVCRLLDFVDNSRKHKVRNYTVTDILGGEHDPVVVDWAKSNIRDRKGGGKVDIAAELQRARQEVEAELQRQELLRRSGVEVDVDYELRRADPRDEFDRGASRRIEYVGPRPTPKQWAMLEAYGLNPKRFTKKQASGVIAKIKAGKINRPESRPAPKAASMKRKPDVDAINRMLLE